MDAGAILVTGGAGFIGGNIALQLLASGRRVVVVDEMNNYTPASIKERRVAEMAQRFPDRFRFVKIDICDQPRMESLFAEEAFDAVIHLAARAGVRYSLENPRIYVHTNVDGTAVLLECLRAHPVRRFLYASSSSVYGGSKDGQPSREDENCSKPKSPYAATKLAKEVMVEAFHHLYGLSALGFRFFTVYGPGGRSDMAPFKFIDLMYRKLPIDQYGDGSTTRDYTFIDDIVRGVLAGLDPKFDGPRHEIYNLGCGRAVSLSYFIETIEGALGTRAQRILHPDQPGDVRSTLADVEKARRDLAYEPCVSIEEGVRKTVAWYQTEYVPLFPSQTT